MDQHPFGKNIEKEVGGDVPVKQGSEFNQARQNVNGSFFPPMGRSVPLVKREEAVQIPQDPDVRQPKYIAPVYVDVFAVLEESAALAAIVEAPANDVKRGRLVRFLLWIVSLLEQKKVSKKKRALIKTLGGVKFPINPPSTIHGFNVVPRPTST